jgi:geranylgeranyl pyrophosphate synthase
VSGVAFTSLEAHLAEELERVEAALDRAVERLEQILPDAIGADAAQTVGAAIRHGVTGGGKRLRPVLCSAAYVACGGERSEALYDLAASLEMIHAYSLMHDDLPCMDDAELRRGRPTTHREHGENATVRAGAVLIPAAALQALTAARALGAPEARARAVTARLLEAAGAGGMVGGQWLDLLGEGRSLGAEELDGLHRRKTGALLAASLVVGATAAGADRTRLDALEAYGRAVGLAFQIADDVLDATATAEALGKNPSDAELDKSTYVALYGLDEARRRATAQADAAIAALMSAGIESPALEALARYVVERGR